MVEITTSDYCDNQIPPVTQTAVLGLVPPGQYSIEFISCTDMALPGEEPCYRAGAGGFFVSEAPIRVIPFASLGTLLALPLLLLFVAARVARRR